MTAPGIRASRSPWTGALALTVLLAAAVAAVLLLSPAARHQARLSSERQAQPYVELYFADQTQARTCPTVGHDAVVDFVVDSHLAAAGPVAWRVAVLRADGDVVRTVSGSATTDPGLATAVATRVEVPERGAHSLLVTLPGRPEELLLHCGSVS